MNGERRATVVVIGTGHQFQRHQDNCPEYAATRGSLEQHVRRLAIEREIQLIAEEAGDDREVWAALKADDEKVPEELRPLFEGYEIANEPQSTIAKMIADELGRRHIDIRSRDASHMTIEERDIAMARQTVESLGSATRVLVIVGEDHRAGVTRILGEQGCAVESEGFPEGFPEGLP